MPPIPLKIAVLDDYFSIAPQHFSRLDPSKYNITYIPDTLLPYSHPSTTSSTKEELVSRLLPYDVIAGMRERTPFPRALLEKLPNLKLLLNTGSRNRAIDSPYCKERNIPVAGAKDLGTEEGAPDNTTQHCVAMILALSRGLVEDDQSVKNGGWQSCLATGLGGKTLGLVGLGRLGSAVAKIMNVAFGMKVIAWSENLTQEKADSQATAASLPVQTSGGDKTFKAVSKHDLFKTADVISVHVILSDRSRGLITKKDMALMKKSAFIVNTSRAPIIDEEDLLETAEKGEIRGIGLDVFELEPLPLDSKWRTDKWGKDGRSRVLLTPHKAYGEEKTMNGYYEGQVENILRWERGEPLLAPLW
ncbi:D-isomer-specific 2-hydroxyacid dehydrogenase-like protein [Zalerion maritima]|uniref:D-isomer-specific 2-hydroxyacid dehydrogenase-like protein n=1 Tax=Zalerion maritima TaxID=339359 RepID=A0AAD5WPU6_9PEZI|nr:D-isomer-specific 2-hydroxyacid dehydrogenase-like protein [Zalerion maritima]